MKKILIILMPLCIIITAGNAQDSVKKIKPASLYGYKNCFGTDNDCPVWFFYNDSCFVLVNQNKGRIKGAGSGTWVSAGDSSISAFFDSPPQFLQPQHIIDYQAEIKYSPDTNYINGQVLRMDGKPLIGGAGVSMIIDGEAMGIVTHEDGKFNFKISRARKTSGFKAQADVDCEIIDFVLQPNSNYHHLVISLPPKDTSLFPLTITSGSHIVKFSRRGLWHLDDPTKMEDLKTLLKDAMIKQPLHKLYFESLLNKLPPDTRK